jgi:hydroxyethylthiazole kinase-like uncharacterized protein yjeF
MHNSDSTISLTCAQAREADRRAIQEFGIPGVVLMENAGRSAAEVILEVLGDAGAVVHGKPCDIYCGPGNNGADGYVIARYLANAGMVVQINLAMPRERLSGDAGVHFGIVEKMGLVIHEPPCHAAYGDRDDLNLGGATVVVDALLGTGSVGPPRGTVRGMIRTINAMKQRFASTVTVFAIDVPSGLDADTGIAGDPTIRANHTITFMAQKRGFLSSDANPFLGQTHVADIGIPSRIVERVSQMSL